MDFHSVSGGAGILPVPFTASGESQGRHRQELPHLFPQMQGELNRAKWKW